jgi:predicted dehydrogenase
VTLNNTGYPMVRQAREMIAGGEIGGIRVVHAAYIQDWLTMPIDADGHKQAEWRTDPTRAGASACLADIGVHAHSLALFVTGLELEAVSADLTTFVLGRRLDDNAHVLLRFQGGARGVLAASQVAVGNLNNLSLKVYGSRAGLEWAGEEPETLRENRNIFSMTSADSKGNVWNFLPQGAGGRPRPALFRRIGRGVSSPAGRANGDPPRRPGR